MPTFPAIAPSSRTFTPGDYPHSPFVALSGEQSRVRHSDAVLGASLELEFIRLTEAERLSIETHYLGQYGEMDSFPLPPETFSGFNPYDFIEGAGLWRYAEPPEIEDFCGPTHDVRVRLVSAPGGVAGVEFGPVVASLASGAVVAGQNGITATITASFAGGAASSTSPVVPQLLLHMEGSGATFTDSSAYARTVTAYGDATQSTSPFKFGAKAAKFANGSGSLRVGSLGLTTDYTLEFWFYLPSWPVGSSKLLANLHGREVFITTAGKVQALGITYATALATETWHYLKLTRQANTVRQYLNGSQFAGEGLSIGTVDYLYLASFFTGGTSGLVCSIDELRIAASADNSLTVPTAAFPDP